MRRALTEVAAYRAKEKKIGEGTYAVVYKGKS